MSGSVERVFDNHLRVAAQTVNFGDLVTFSYDADGFQTGAGDLTMSRDVQNGLLTGTSLGSVADSYGRNGFGEVMGYAASYDGNPLLSITYERDELGRIKRKTESVEGGTAVDTYYVYDPAGRLVRVCDDEPVDGECFSERAEYEYDSNSNRIGGHDQVSGTITATYDTQDRLLTYNGATYTYTANGELETKTEGSDVTTYDYDALGNLRQVVLHAQDPNEAQVIDYLIDGQNRRIGKKVDGTLVQAFLYENQLRPVAELDGGGNVVSRFVYGENVNVPEYVVKGGVAYRIITDHLGSPRAIVDTATGALAQRLEYDEFGNVVADTNPGFQPFGFAGGIYDSHTKLTRFGARDYDARTSRWSAKDPIRFASEDTSLYAYALLDPINLKDPGGAFVGSYPGTTITIVGSIVRVTTAAGAVVVGGYVVQQIAWYSECLLWKGASKLALALGDYDFKPRAGFEECAEPRDCDHQYYNIDIPTCRAVARRRGPAAGRRCYASAAERYAACLSGGPLPPLDTWNN